MRIEKIMNRHCEGVSDRSNLSVILSGVEGWAFPSMTQVGLSATIFFAKSKKGFPLQSLTQTTVNNNH